MWCDEFVALMNNYMMETYFGELLDDVVKEKIDVVNSYAHKLFYDLPVGRWVNENTNTAKFSLILSPRYNTLDFLILPVIKFSSNTDEMLFKLRWQ